MTERLPPMLVVATGKPDEEIVLTEAAEGEPVNYYRDEKDVHYVPKRRLEDLVVTAKSAARTGAWRGRIS